MKKAMKIGKSIFLIIVILIGLFLLYVFIKAAFLGGAIFFKTVKEGLAWREHTIPLSEKVVDDLCTEFELDPEDDRCDHSGDEVYGPDFYSLLYETFTPKNANWATREEVDERIGDYRYDCDIPSIDGEGREFISCDYDFAGDRAFKFEIWFFSDGEVKRIIADITN